MWQLTNPLQRDASDTDLEDFWGPNFPILDFNCLNGQYSVTLKGINVFEWANEHLKTGVIALQYDAEFQEVLAN